MKAILTGHQPKEIVDNPMPPNVAPAYMPNKVSWHTGIPTEEGDYWIAYRHHNNGLVKYGKAEWCGKGWIVLSDDYGHEKILAYQKVEEKE